MVRAIESRGSAYKRESSFQNVFFAVILERTFCLHVVSIERESGGKLERKYRTRGLRVHLFFQFTLREKVLGGERVWFLGQDNCHWPLDVLTWCVGWLRLIARLIR
jgi:hypothetical protein